jgi:2-octaprenyl-6-methoxyphenol hydroxylase
MTQEDMSRAKTIELPPEVTVIGGGPVGYLSALCLAARLPSSQKVRLIMGRKTPPVDGRAAAIVGRSMGILDSLGLGEVFREEGAPLAAIRIIDVTGRLLRAPTTVFRASDTGLAEFGVSLTTAKIVELLTNKARTLANLEIAPVDIQSIERAETGFYLIDDEGKGFAAPFVVAADGQRSMAREAAGISVRKWSYDQTALTFVVTHKLDHEDISTEFHTADGPFTLVPSGHLTSTVVWMMRPGEAERLMALDPETFALTAEKTCRSILGKLTLCGSRGAYPMGGLLAESFIAPNIALVGETAHAFPPIGAQGLNLGFRDADSLADVLTKAVRNGFSIADVSLTDWDRNRCRDAGLRTAGVDAFNRSLLTDFLPVSAARGLGLMVLKNIAPLRRSVMRMGLAE